jgi:hypothetical protein
LFLHESGIQHLLIDLPSVDKEKDEGKLLAHKAFWNVTDVKKFECLIGLYDNRDDFFVADEVKMVVIC